jgi:hypothetical protein
MICTSSLRFADFSDSPARILYLLLIIFFPGGNTVGPAFWQQKKSTLNRAPIVCLIPVAELIGEAVGGKGLA